MNDIKPPYIAFVVTGVANEKVVEMEKARQFVSAVNKEYTEDMSATEQLNGDVSQIEAKRDLIRQTSQKLVQAYNDVMKHADWIQKG
jgi:uncharacterized coiled-coil DUF342 family protein